MTDYRYSLHREWHTLDTSGRLCWVMLNPSTADDTTDDPTIRRCIRFSSDNGYAELEVVNLFAARATNPKTLRTIADPVGPENDAHIEAAFGRADAVVFAWGSTLSSQLAVMHRGMVCGAACRTVGKTPHTLGFTTRGFPRHPLYVPASQPLEEWWP